MNWKVPFLNLSIGEEESEAIIKVITSRWIAADKSTRDIVREQLSAKGVQTSIHYRPVHLFEIYRNRFGCKRGDLPLTEWAADHELTLPLYPRMTKENLAYVTESLKECLVSSK